MKKLLLISMVAGLWFFGLQAQDRKLPADEVVETKHQVTIKGQAVPYRAVTGTQPVWDKDGKTIAALFFTYYERTDVKDRACALTRTSASP